MRRPSAQSAEAAADPLRVEGLAAIICAMATSSTDIMSIMISHNRSNRHKIDEKLDLRTKYGWIYIKNKLRMTIYVLYCTYPGTDRVTEDRQPFAPG